MSFIFFFLKPKSNFIHSLIERESKYNASNAEAGDSSIHTKSSSTCLA